MIILPNAKQKRCIIPALILYVILEGYIMFRSIPEFITDAVFSVVFAALAVWHTVLYVRDSSKNVTAFLPSVIAIGGARILYKLVSFFLALSGFSVKGLLILLMEVLYWAVLVFTIIRAVCGKCKLMIPMFLLFFGFLYLFISIDLRAFSELISMICLLLLLWFPVDSVIFTSFFVPPKSSRRRKR